MPKKPGPAMPEPGIPGLPCSPAAERNRGPILDVLTRWLPPTAAVLEVASGTGQHAAHCAAARPGWRWQPTEGDPAALPAIAAWCAGLANVDTPLPLDVRSGPWPAPAAPAPGWDAVFCANLIHIAPWPVTLALLQGAAHVLAPGGSLLLYGPFHVDGEPLAAGNRAFDADLRARDPAWGLRRLAAVQAAAQAAGLRLDERVAMPANNLMLRWRSV
jgi:SAM-dependent methyltransferase